MNNWMPIAAAALLSVNLVQAKDKDKDAEPATENQITNIESLSPHQQLQYNSLILVEDDFRAEQNDVKKRRLAKELIAQSQSLADQVPNLRGVWEMRGKAALFVGDWNVGWTAGRNLLRLGALTSTDRELTLLTARLNRRGWLDDDPRVIELRELRRVPELKDDADLPEEVRKELADTINKLTSDDSWSGYNQLKALRLKIGEEAILQYPLARRALAVGLPTASSRGDTALARAAIASGADVNMSMGGRSALFWAAYNAEPGIVRLLLTAGANPKVADKFGRSILVEPTWKGNAEIVNMLLEAGADPNVPGKKVRLLHEAVERGHHKVVAAFVANNANLRTLKSDDDPMPILFHPIRTGDLKMVEALLSGGADPRIEYKDRSMFWHASKLDQDEIEDALKLAKKKKLYYQ